MFFPAAIFVVSVLGAAPKPSVAVLGFLAKEGVPSSLADVLTENTVTELRRSNQFSQVVSFSEVQLALNVEAQKQMLNCDTEGCLAEIAGSLGTDLVCAGTVTKLGTVTVLNIRLVEAKNGRGRASVGRNLRTQDVGEVVLALPDVVKELLGKLDEGSPPDVQTAPKEETVPPTMEKPPVVDVKPSEKHGPHMGLLALAGVAGGAALVSVLMGVVGVSLMMGTLALTQLTGSDRYAEVLQGGFLVGAAVLVVAPLVLLLMLVAAGASLVGAWVIP